MSFFSRMFGFLGLSLVVMASFQPVWSILEDDDGPNVSSHGVVNQGKSSTSSEVFQPRFDDFMDKGWVVHVGTVIPQLPDLKDDRPVVGAVDLVSYWSLNSVVQDPRFLEDAFLPMVVLKPLKSVLPHLISLNGHEIITASRVPLGEGDIVFYRQGGCNNSKKFPLSATNAYFNREDDNSDKGIVYGTEAQFRDQFTKFGIRVVPFDVDIKRQFKYSDPFNNLGDTRPVIAVENIIRKKLEDKKAWVMTSPAVFWTHRTPFKINGVDVDPLSFFNPIIERYPNISLGYEFYSLRGLSSFPCILRSLMSQEHALGAPTYAQFRDLHKMFYVFAYDEWMKGVEAMDHLSENSRNFLVAEPLNMRLKFAKEREHKALTTPRDLSSFEVLIDFVTMLSPEYFEKFIAQNDFAEKDVIKDVYTLIDCYRNKDRKDTHEMKKGLYDNPNLPFSAKRTIYALASEIDGIHMDISILHPLEVAMWFISDGL